MLVEKCGKKMLVKKKSHPEMLSLRDYTCFVKLKKSMRYLEKQKIVNPNFLEEKDLFLTEYNKMVEAGLDGIRNNRVISKDDLEREMLDWDND